MAKRAAIYVRTSSDHQGEKSSPDEQEADCRALAEQQGLTVVKVYRDISKYRVKSRLVDPSGTRTDRPGLVALLEEASQGHFEVILAWREDRLYRGMRAMLLVLDVVQQYNIEVMLARETFDSKMAPLKAWVAQMELEGMRERMTMGVKARLRAGKANTGQDRYGYRRVDDHIEIVDEEAEWVQQVIDWYLEGLPKLEIRRRLIAAGVPQKGSSIPRKIEWAISSIDAIIFNSEAYASGKKRYTRKGEVFEIPCPTIIDWATHLKVLEKRHANKTYPSRNVKFNYLAGGLLYCQCDRKWTAVTVRHRGKRKHHKTIGGVYQCSERHPERIHPNCPRTAGAKKIDDLLWQKVKGVIAHPEALLAGARGHVEVLRGQVNEMLAEKHRLEEGISKIVEQRQWIIRQARRGGITEQDMDNQLAELSAQEASLHTDLASKVSHIELVDLGDWEAQITETIDRLRRQIKLLDAEPQTEEARQQQFDLKRRIVEFLVDRVMITKERDLQVVFKVDMTSILTSNQQPDQDKPGETCNHTQ